jgi:hypothetical protein
VEWIDRDAADTVPNGVEWAWFDDAGRVVGLDDREWSTPDRTVVPEQPGSSQVVATFDGGFIATYAEGTGELRAEIIRGWPDGTVEYWVLPGSWLELGSPVPEPMGTVLLPVGGGFYRVAPFDDRTPDLGTPSVDLETGQVDVEALDAAFQALAADDPLRTLGPEALANAIAGPVASPAELRTMTPGPTDVGSRIAVTTERHLDDSVYGTRYDMELLGDLSPIQAITWSQTCQPDRGHQDYQSELCV